MSEQKKIKCRDEFELCYLRHTYLRKVTHKTTVEEMEPYQRIIAFFAKKTFFTYRPLFLSVGLEWDDVTNIANVHLVSFLGLFSLEQMPRKYLEFISTFERIQEQKPKECDFLDKNQANFTLFLKQRLEDLVRVCRQKAKNIKGVIVDAFCYYYGPNVPPRPLSELLKNYEKLGFRKLDPAIYKSIRKKKKVFDNSPFMIGKNYYVAVPMEKKSVTVHDLDGAGTTPHGTLHSMTPEEVYFIQEDDRVWAKRQEEFNNSSLRKKKFILKKFIANNKGNRSLRTEIGAARHILKELSHGQTL